MKFSNLIALEKHLREAPHSAAYLIACPYEADRREIASKILAALGNREVLRFAGAEGFSAALQEVQSASLFTEERAIVLDGIDDVKEEERAPLLRWLARPSEKTVLILGVASARGLAPFLQSTAPLLDLLQEKPWERQQRIGEDLRRMAREAKIAIDDEVFDFLFQQVGVDWALLKRELEKLLAYAQGKNRLRLEEAQALVSAGVFPEGWALAEQLIFQTHGIAAAPSLDTSGILALVGQLRYYLRLGRQLALGEEKGLKPYQVQKFKERSRAKGPRFFEKGILALNEVEALLKSSSVNAELLLHRFAVRLHV